VNAQFETKVGNKTYDKYIDALVEMLRLKEMKEVPAGAEMPYSRVIEDKKPRAREIAEKLERGETDTVLGLTIEEAFKLKRKALVETKSYSELAKLFNAAIKYVGAEGDTKGISPEKAAEIAEHIKHLQEAQPLNVLEEITNYELESEAAVREFARLSKDSEYLRDVLAPLQEKPAEYGLTPEDLVRFVAEIDVLRTQEEVRADATEGMQAAENGIAKANGRYDAFYGRMIGAIDHIGRTQQQRVIDRMKLRNPPRRITPKDESASAHLAAFLVTQKNYRLYIDQLSRLQEDNTYRFRWYWRIARWALFPAAMFVGIPAASYVIVRDRQAYEDLDITEKAVAKLDGEQEIDLDPDVEVNAFLQIRVLAEAWEGFRNDNPGIMKDTHFPLLPYDEKEKVLRLDELLEPTSPLRSVMKQQIHNLKQKRQFTLRQRQEFYADLMRVVFAMDKLGDFKADLKKRGIEESKVIVGVGARAARVELTIEQRKALEQKLAKPPVPGGLGGGVLGGAGK
jgi:hypothetical protein